jgi:hypothetical protein
MAVPNIFGTATAAIPLSQLDTNFATAITLGNTAVYLGNTTTSLGNVTLTNVTISSGNVSVSTATVGAGSNTAPSITTTGDTNTGIFFPAADTIAFTEGGAEAMRIDSSGNVGIGTTAPSGRLHVSSSGAAIAYIQSTQVAGNTNVETRYISTNRSWGVGQNIIQTSSIFEIADVTASATRLAIDSSGNVGIGVTPSAWLSTTKVLQIGDRASIFTNSSEQTLVGNNVYVNSSSQNTYIETALASLYQQAAGVHYWYNAPSGTAGNAITFTQAMTLDASGNLGIGTTAPSSKLQVSNSTNGGAVEITAANTYYLATSTDETVVFQGEFFQNDLSANRAAGYMQIGKSGDFSNAANASGFMAFATRAAGTIAEKMRIDSAGNVQVQAGAVMPYAPAPAAISAAATLTNANIQGQIISATGTTYTITMPLGTTLETLATWVTTGIAYDFYIINAASGTITLDATEVGVTSVGTMTIATGVSAQFRIRRTAANTFVVYRLG